MRYNTHRMGDALKQRIKQERFSSAWEEALLNVIVASNHVRELSERVVAEYGITLPQYNVLRILRGAHPSGHPRYEIAARMVDRAPDVTRIIDRLEQKGYVGRDRGVKDRRHSVTIITDKGLELLAQLDGPIDQLWSELRRGMSVEDCEELSRLCEHLYG